MVSFLQLPTKITHNSFIKIVDRKDYSICWRVCVCMCVWENDCEEQPTKQHTHTHTPTHITNISISYLIESVWRKMSYRRTIDDSLLTETKTSQKKLINKNKRIIIFNFTVIKLILWGLLRILYIDTKIIDTR